MENTDIIKLLTLPKSGKINEAQVNRICRAMNDYGKEIETNDYYIENYAKKLVPLTDAYKKKILGKLQQMIDAYPKAYQHLIKALDDLDFIGISEIKEFGTDTYQPQFIVSGEDFQRNTKFIIPKNTILIRHEFYGRIEERLMELWNAEAKYQMIEILYSYTWGIKITELSKFKTIESANHALLNSFAWRYSLSWRVKNPIMERIDIKTWEDAAECAKHSNNVLKVYPPDRKGLYRFDIGKSIYAIKELHN